MEIENLFVLILLKKIIPVRTCTHGFPRTLMLDEPLLPGSLLGHEIFLQQIALTRLRIDFQAGRCVAEVCARLHTPENKHKYSATSDPYRSEISYLMLSYTNVPKTF